MKRFFGFCLMAASATGCTSHYVAEASDAHRSVRVVADEGLTSHQEVVTVRDRSDLDACVEAVVEGYGEAFRKRADLLCRSWPPLGIPSRREMMYGPGYYGRVGSGEDLMRNQPQVGLTPPSSAP